MTLVDEQTSFPSTSAIPHNREAEEALLGAILVDPANLSDVQDRLGLGSYDFYIVRHRFIWEAFIELRKANQPIDYLMVCTQLEKAGQLSEIGGPAYLTSLLNQVPFTGNAMAYGEMVIAESIRRKVITACNLTATRAFDTNLPPEKLLDGIPGTFPDMSGTQSHVSTIEQASIDFMTDLDNTGNKAIPCHMIIRDDIGHEHIVGVTDLTTNLGGIPLGYTTLVAGATGTGKTTWGLLQAQIASQLGYKVLYVSTETSDMGIIRKLACGVLGISPKLLRRGEADDLVLQDLKDEANALISLHTGKLYFDSHSTTVQGIKSSIARICPDLCIVDHLGELTYDGDNRTIGIGDNYSELSQFCNHRENMALVVFHHIDITVTDRPTLADLRWARGDLSQKADVVLTMFRKDLVDAKEDPAGAIMARKKPVPVEFWIRKDREGPRDVLCKALYDLKYQRFETPGLMERQTLFDN
jgi:replicative DNA helicase